MMSDSNNVVADADAVPIQRFVRRIAYVRTSRSFKLPRLSGSDDSTDDTDHVNGLFVQVSGATAVM